MRGVSLWQPWASWLFTAPPCSCAGCDPDSEVEAPHQASPLKWIETRPQPAASTIVGERIVVHSTKRPVDLDELLLLRAKAAFQSDEPKFMGLPDAWFDDRTVICQNGHVSTSILKTDRGDRCLACTSQVLMVPPVWGRFGDMPLGALLGTVRVVMSVEMVDGDTSGRPFPYLWLSPNRLQAFLYLDACGRDVSDQIMFGDFRPGRYAWLLEDAVRFVEPVPYRGKQGVMIVDDGLIGAGVPVIESAARTVRR